MQGKVLDISFAQPLARTSPVGTAKNKAERIQQQQVGGLESPQSKSDSTAFPASESQKVTTPAQAVDLANSVAALFNTKLSFAYEESLGRMVVTVKDGETGEIIRQIPPEEMVEIAAKFQQDSRGIILNFQG